MEGDYEYSITNSHCLGLRRLLDALPAHEGEPLLLALLVACVDVLDFTKVVSESPAEHSYAWSLCLVLFMKIPVGLRLLHKSLLAAASVAVGSVAVSSISASSVSASSCEGDDGSGCVGAHRPSSSPPIVSSNAASFTTPSARAYVTTAEAHVFLGHHRQGVRTAIDLLGGPDAPPLFIAASAVCKTAWASTQRDANTRATALLQLLSRGATPEEAVATIAADLAPLLTHATAWDTLVADVLKTAPAALAMHLQPLSSNFCAKVERGRACSDMSEDGPDARELSFSGATPAVTVDECDVQPHMALISPPAGAAAGATAVENPMGGASTETPWEGFR